nr:acyl-CoA thioesterase [Lachnospiraceae bacterium]
MKYEKGLKRVEDSKTEWMKCIQYEDINGSNRLFGGRLLQWMDEVAGIAAIRHAGIQVTTAAIDNLQF